MRRIDIVFRLDDAERARLIRFVEEVAAASGTRPLSDHLWLDLLDGGAPGFLAATASELSDGEPRLVGLAQMSPANAGVVLEVVTARAGASTDPASDAAAVATDLADTAIDALRRTGGGRVTWWVDDADRSVTAVADAHGLTLERSLHEMRRSLPHPDRSAAPTRAFEPGVDDDAWLAVNNRAFAAHGEQGGWTNEALALRMAEPWFDPDGFRLYEEDGTLRGFCWTKVHSEDDPPVGEIYVIAVDPAAHGRGLGRELTLAGLDWLADHGIGQATLYVDAANAAAVRLYERLGFVVHRTRFAYSGRLERA